MTIHIDTDEAWEIFQRYHKEVMKEYTKQIALVGRKELRLASTSTKRHRGQYKRGWKVRIEEGTSKSKITFYSNIEWARYVHDGSRAHIIRPKYARSLKFEKDGRIIFARKVNHPGYKGRHDFDVVKHKVQNRANSIFQKILAQFK